MAKSARELLELGELPELVDYSEYHNYVPAASTIHIDKSEWQGVGLNLYSFTGNNEGIPAPGVGDYSLALMLSGQAQGYCSYNESAWKPTPILPSTCVLINKDTPIAWQWQVDNPNTELTSANLILDRDLVRKVADESGRFINADLELMNKSDIYDPFLTQLVLQMKSEANTDTDLLYVQQLTRVLIMHLLRNYMNVKTEATEYKNGLSRQHQQRVINYINDNLGQKITLENLSVLAGLSDYHFARMFKKSMGVAPNQYVMRCRLEKAKELLKTGEHSIQEIANAVGYENPSHFIRIFKRYVGVTPAKYRKTL